MSEQQITSSNTLAEQRIARKCYMFFLTIEYDTTWRMPRSMESYKIVGAKCYDLIILQIMLRLDNIIFKSSLSIDFLNSYFNAIHPGSISLVNFWEKAKYITNLVA